MGLCLACCSSPFEPGVELYDLQPLPLPEGAPRPHGNPPKDPNFAFVLSGNVSKIDFINAYAEVFAHSIVKPGDGVNQAAGFENQKWGKQLSNGCVIQEHPNPVNHLAVNLVISMKPGANHWTARLCGNSSAMVRGITVIVEVTEPSPNRTNVRILARYDGPIPPQFGRYLFRTDFYGKIMRHAEMIAKK